MEEFEARLHRTWLSLLVASNYREVAALAVDSELRLLKSSFQTDGIIVDISPSAYPFIASDDSIKQIVEKTLRAVASGHLLDQNGGSLEADEITIEFRIKLLAVEQNWREVIKEMIVNAKDANQGNVTEKVFAREKKQVYLYNEMKFGSQSEIRIAQELERRGVLFFPLPLAVRRDMGNLYKDHREVDFLVCVEGTWGILEVSFHPDRFEKDAEKDSWFKASGILCVQHYSAERCYNQSSSVVDEFLSILAKHKR